MRTNIFFLSFLFLISNITIAQLRFDYPITEYEPTKIVVRYSLIYQQDSLFSDFHNQADMMLQIGTNYSKFVSVNQYRADTILRNVDNDLEFQDFLLNPGKPYPKIRYEIYKNYTQGNICYAEHLLGNSLYYEEDLNIFDWILSTDTSTIGSFKVQKACCDFGGRHWIAWFATELPYPDGPYKFNGLPGLILSIHDSQNHYVFNFLTIEKLNYRLMIDRKELGYKRTTKCGFFKAKDSYRENIISLAKEAGLNSTDQKTAARSVMERNNPIELIRK